MRAARGTALAAFAALAGAGTLGALEVSVREIRVERPGTVRVELAVDEIVRLGDAGGVEVRGPAGERVGAERHLARTEAPCQPAGIAAVERRADGWQLRIAVPAGMARHGALDFELDEATLAPGCRLEARGHGGRWQPLAEGDLFRVGEGDSLARTRLVYPVSAARELRLDWPASAGYPKVRAARICAPEEPRPPLPRPARLERVLAPPGRSRFSLALPPRAARLAALEIALPRAPAGELGWRLEFGQEGRWRELSRGLWPGRRERHRIELGDVAFAGRELLLELEGEAVGEPSATWELAPQVVRFAADRTGTWTLRLPAAATAPSFAPADRVADFTVAEARLERTEWPAPRPGAPAADLQGERRFAMATAEGGPGTPLALELSPDLLAAAGPAAADLRLVAAGRLVPARVEELPEPRRVALLENLTPRPAAAGRSAVEIDLGARGAAAAGVETTGLVLYGGPSARPFRRDIDLIGIGGGAGPDRETLLGRLRWECAAGAADPCELFLEPGLLRFARLRLELEDGDSEPLAGLSAELLARRRQLVFQRPAEAPQLVAGTGGSAPSYDLAQLDSALALAPPAPAGLGAELARGGRGAERWGRPLLIAGVVAAAVALLLLLRRLLPAAGGTG